MSGEIGADDGIGAIHQVEIIRDQVRERDVRAVAVIHLLMVLAVLAQSSSVLTGMGHSPGISGLGGPIVLFFAPVYAIVVGWGLFVVLGLWRNSSNQAHSVQAGPARPKARPTTMMVAPKTR